MSNNTVYGNADLNHTVAIWLQKCQHLLALNLTLKEAFVMATKDELVSQRIKQYFNGSERIDRALACWNDDGEGTVLEGLEALGILSEYDILFIVNGANGGDAPLVFKLLFDEHMLLDFIQR